MPFFKNNCRRFLLAHFNAFHSKSRFHFCIRSTLESPCSDWSAKQPFKFNELDALIIALRRKISALATQGWQAETLPLARRVIALLDDYEAHPDRYHDGSYREPPAEKREDYIRFYRTQAENFVASANMHDEHSSVSTLRKKFMRIVYD